jgi:hypothetical protein
MGAPALCEGKRMVTPRLGPQKGAYFVKDATETRSGTEGFEPTHRPIALLNGVPVVLEQKTTILGKCLYLLASLKDSPGLDEA